MVNRKLSFYSEQRVPPWLGMSDLRPDLFEQARSLLNVQRRNHPWVKLNDEELLRIGGFIRKDPITSAVGYTLAAALMFGSDATIQEAAPATITIFRHKVVFCNPHVPRLRGRIDPTRFTPFPWLNNACSP